MKRRAFALLCAAAALAGCGSIRREYTLPPEVARRPEDRLVQTDFALVGGDYARNAACALIEIEKQFPQEQDPQNGRDERIERFFVADWPEVRLMHYSQKVLDWEIRFSKSEHDRTYYRVLAPDSPTGPNRYGMIFDRIIEDCARGQGRVVKARG